MTDAIREEKRTHNKLAFAWLLISQIAAVGSLVIWFGVAMMSFMAFDSGVSSGALLFVAAIWLYPILVVVCIVAAWRAYRASRDTAALVWTTLPLLLALAVVGFMLSG